MKKKVIIIGAGPAGLTAARECLNHPHLEPIIIEQSSAMGGISRTVQYKGNRIDIGGHRFFSKSDRVMDWWLEFFPVEPEENLTNVAISYQNKSRSIDLEKLTPSEEQDPDRRMLLRERLSRIFFMRKFFDYPISFSLTTVMNLGLIRMTRIGISYIKARLFPIRNEKNLEDFFINRFGRQLYATFFRDYTEKVWGVKCTEIKPEWGRQRIKGLSVSKALLHALTKWPRRKRDLKQKTVETSLIERFLYPKYGPGQMWEAVADTVKKEGGTILTQHKVLGIQFDGQKVRAVTALNQNTGQQKTLTGDYFISTMPIKDLLTGFNQGVPREVLDIARCLQYRDFITVGVLAKELLISDSKDGTKRLIKDNWIYIQEPDVKVGRLQIFNNWSPYMVENQKHVWLGMEYFCNAGDDLWEMSDDQFSAFALKELETIGFVHQDQILDHTVIRVEKTYPGYFGDAYAQFHRIRHFADSIENLFLVGRNGMHRYNNQDHSMLTAMTAIENIVAGRSDKSNIWDINTEQEYHEAKEDDYTLSQFERQQQVGSTLSPCNEN